MADRAVRSLAHLNESASTSRVLNLVGVHRRCKNDPAYYQQPFFRSSLLNRAILLKHRLRADERHLFGDGRATVTKIIVPIDSQDLRLGGRYVFVDQLNFEATLTELLGSTWLRDRSDLILLRLIDRLPTLDPFLLREQLKRHGFAPARCYFDLSEGDLARMSKFVENEIQRLVDLCYANDEVNAGEGRPARLVAKILSSSVDAETEPLRLTLRLERSDYQEGVFCWKGFLYYKWKLGDTLDQVTRVADAIVGMKLQGPTEPELLAQLGRSRGALRASILEALEAAWRSLRYYDQAFDNLIGGEPRAFRDFLLTAPEMFCDLGERLGAISHIVSYWNFRFPQKPLPAVTGVELLDIVTDFGLSLAFGGPSPSQQGGTGPAATRAGQATTGSQAAGGIVYV